jgi:hypothetical protein
MSQSKFSATSRTEHKTLVKVQNHLYLNMEEQLRFIQAAYFSILTNIPDFYTSYVTFNYYVKYSVFSLQCYYTYHHTLPPQRTQLPNLITVLFVKYFINFSQRATYIIHASSPKPPTLFFLEQKLKSFHHP